MNIRKSLEAAFESRLIRSALGSARTLVIGDPCLADRLRNRRRPVDAETIPFKAENRTYPLVVLRCNAADELDLRQISSLVESGGCLRLFINGAGRNDRNCWIETLRSTGFSAIAFDPRLLRDILRFGRQSQVSLFAWK